MRTTAGATTVAVAACGRPDALGRCLEAIERQTARPAQVIVVDQAPSEQARRVVAESGLGADYLEQERTGLSASRNLALRTATGTVIAVTDDDCAPDPGWLAAIESAFSRTPSPGAVTGSILPPAGDPPPGTHPISLRESGVAVDYRGRIVPWGVGSGANFAAPVDSLRRHDGWDERLGAGSLGMAAEDAELIYRLLIGGELVRYEPQAVIRHEWQTRERRIATRWSYGYGIGAMCGLRLADRDWFALRMLGGYARLHLRPLAVALARRDLPQAGEHLRALAGAAPGLV